MRDAFGGTMMIEIMMVFIVLFVAFTAVIVNVAKTFRIKNEVINIVEQYKYDGSDKDNGAINQVETYLANAGYNAKDLVSAKKSCTKDGASWNDNYGFCLKKQGESNNYYKVTVYVYIHLPFFNLDFTIPVSGESKIVTSLG